MKVYIAGSFPARERLRPMGGELWKLGIEVVSSWLNEVQKPPFMTLDTFHKKLAIKDIAEVKSADIVILDNLDELSRGGKSVEWGVGAGKFQTTLLYLIGPATNVFHQLADQQFETWDECLAYVKTHHSQPIEKLPF